MRTRDTHIVRAARRALVTTPLVTKALTAGVIIGAGDAAAQQLERRSTGEPFDVARYGRWAAFGLLLQGPWNHAFYQLLDGAFPPTPDPFTLTTLEKARGPPARAPPSSRHPICIDGDTIPPYRHTQ